MVALDVVMDSKGGEEEGETRSGPQCGLAVDSRGISTQKAENRAESALVGPTQRHRIGTIGTELVSHHGIKAVEVCRLMIEPG
jgi:hypothetical protein